MELINTIIGTPLGWLFRLCVNLAGKYGLGIILFTLFVKVIMLPLSIWVQKNSIKMVKIKPKVNEIDAEYIYDPARGDELKLALYKEEHYKPLAGMIPTFIQIPIILGLVTVIYHPLQHLLGIDSGLTERFVELAKEILGKTELGSGAQITVMELVKNSLHTAAFASVSVAGADTASAIQAISALDTRFLGLELSQIPGLFRAEWLTLIPWLAAASSFLLSVLQNRANVLQKEANFAGRWGMALFLVAFSLYFASVVPAGVGLYWICSNLFSIPVLYLCNLIYPPRKSIDYVALEESKRHLSEAKALSKAAKPTKEDKIRAKADYKRFFSAGSKQIVFYSEKSGYYKYFRRLIEALLRTTDYTIHYITSDPHDAIFNNTNERIIPYYIDDNRLITLFMQVDSDVMVTSLPDLDTFYLKRSIVQKKLEYIYVHHSIIGGLATLRDHAFDAYDTLFCGEKNQKREMLEYVEREKLPPKNLIECGYGVIEDMHEEYLKLRAADVPHSKRKILIAPSWQADNIIESYLPVILPLLLNGENQVIMRPHPQYIRRFGAKLEEVKRTVAEYLGEDCAFELDFSSNATVYTADLLITDWSTIAYEYSFATERPVLFIHTPMKTVNERSDSIISGERLDITLRSQIGVDLMPETLNETLVPTVEHMLGRLEAYQKEIAAIRDEYVYNFGASGDVGAAYIKERVELAEKRREEEGF